MPSLPASWATDEPQASLWFERAINAGVNIGSMAFGVHMVIYATCTYHLYRSKKFPWMQQVYITVLFTLAAVTIACTINFNELAWVDERNYPGGPLAFINEREPLPVNTIGNSAGLVITLLVDSLLIYRCWIVWNTNYYVIVLPILMLLASTVLSCFQTIASSQPASSLWATNTVKFGLAYLNLTMTLNMLVTAIIITRLLLARRKIRSIMGDTHGREYTSITAMLVESALPTALVSLVLIALYAHGNTAMALFFPLLPQVQALAPQLIFIRVLRGRAWSKETMTPNVSSRTLQFIQPSSGTFADPITRVRKTETSSFDSHELSAIVKVGDSSFTEK